MTLNELIAKLTKARDTFRAGELPVWITGTEWDFEPNDVKFKSSSQGGRSYAAQGDNEFPDRLVIE